jgi:hypothetical protein
LAIPFASDGHLDFPRDQIPFLHPEISAWLGQWPKIVWFAARIKENLGAALLLRVGVADWTPQAHPRLTNIHLAGRISA